MDNKALVQEKTAELIDVLVTTLKESKSVVVEQAPLVIEQLLMWNFWKSLAVWSVSAVILIISLVFFAHSAWGMYGYSKYYSTEFPENQKWEKYTKTSDDIRVLIILCSGVCIVVCSALCVCVIDWLQILLAEKVWLLNYLKSTF